MKKEEALKALDKIVKNDNSSPARKTRNKT